MKFPTPILDTERLQLTKLTLHDAPFILSLLNDPAWLQHIGDRGVNNLDDARSYILDGPLRSYAQRGFGLYLTRLKDGNVPIGLCGLLKRESLPHVDIGFAFLPDYRGKGYAYEAATAVLHYGHTTLGLKHLIGIVSPENPDSIRLLTKLGLRYEKMVQLEDGTHCQLFSQKT
ncbi:MAG: GNAT family N-acetyltransferase [Cyclobacteriaceae bacterium]